MVSIPESTFSLLVLALSLCYLPVILLYIAFPWWICLSFAILHFLEQEQWLHYTGGTWLFMHHMIFATLILLVIMACHQLSSSSWTCSYSFILSLYYDCAFLYVIPIVTAFHVYLFALLLALKLPLDLFAAYLPSPFIIMELLWPNYAFLSFR